MEWKEWAVVLLVAFCLIGGAVHVAQESMPLPVVCTSCSTNGKAFIMCLETPCSCHLPNRRCTVCGKTWHVWGHATEEHPLKGVLDRLR